MRFHCGCHGNKVTIAMRYEIEPIVPKNLHTKHGLDMTYDKRVIDVSCGCHGNLVTIATRYVADAYHPKEPPYQIWTQYDLRQRSYKIKCLDSDSLITHSLIGLIK